MTKFENSQI